MGEIKIKDQLSPAEAEIRAELGTAQPQLVSTFFISRDIVQHDDKTLNSSTAMAARP